MQKYFFAKPVLREACFIIAIATLLGLTANFFNPKGVSLGFRAPTIKYAPDDVFAQELPVAGIGNPEDELSAQHEAVEPALISTRQVRHLLDQNQAILIDARLSEHFEKGHIPGAHNIPFERFYEYEERIQSLPKDKWLITYCDGPPCELGEMLAYELFHRGFPMVAIYQAGLDDWNLTPSVEKGGRSFEK